MKKKPSLKYLKIQTAIGCGLGDIKGNSPTICIPRIILEDEAKPTRKDQRRLNHIMFEVVKREILELLA